MQTDHNSQQNPDEQSGKLHLFEIADATDGTQHSGPPKTTSSPNSSGKAQAAQAEPFFFYQEDDELDDLQAGNDPFGQGMAVPFQLSEEMPAQPAATGQTSHVSSSQPSPPRSRSFPLWRVLLLILMILVIVFAGVMTVFAQGISLQTSAPPVPAKTAPAGKEQATPGTALGPSSGTNAPADQKPWFPNQLPAGWIEADLTLADALFAQRAAIAFTDREMSLDYRSVGTRIRHGGTYTAALFILTPAAQARFARNDVRMINNVLFDTVAQEKRIQAVINPQPRLLKFEAFDGQQFAWVDVAFELWRSIIDPATEQRLEGIDTVEGKKEIRIYHMQVLLLRFPQNAGGANPPMGGTGWLVSTYGLNLPAGTMLDILQPA